MDADATITRRRSEMTELMSGGKKTLKEIANFLGNPVAVDVEGRLLWFPGKPEKGLVAWIWYDEQFGCFGEELPKNLIDFNGDWKDSLTLPDGWEHRFQNKETKNGLFNSKNTGKQHEAVPR